MYVCPYVPMYVCMYVYMFFMIVFLGCYCIFEVPVNDYLY